MKHLDKNFFGEELLTDLHKYEVFLDKRPTQEEIDEAKKKSDKYRASQEEWNFYDYWEFFLSEIENLGYKIQPIEYTTLEIC
ncbi:hypothetical protein ES708_26643 [subsurface metagenome]